MFTVLFVVISIILKVKAVPPLPAFHISSNSGELRLDEGNFQVTRAITLDLSNTPATGTNYYLLRNGEASYLADTSSTTKVQFKFSFSTPGIHKLTVYSSDAVFAQSPSGDYYSVSTTQTSPSSQSFYLEVSDLHACFKYYSSFTSNSTFYTFNVLVKDLSTGTDYSSMLQFAGEYPQLKAFNLTHSQTYSGVWSDQSSSWIVHVPTSFFSVNSPMQVSIDSSGSFINSCKVSSAHVTVTRSNLTSIAVGYNLSSSGSASLLAASFAPTHPRLIVDKCIPNNQLLILPTQLTSNRQSTGAVIALSTSSLDQFALFDLTRNHEGGTGKSLCDSLSDCSNLVILDAAMVRSVMYILTNQGLYYGKSFTNGTFVWNQLAKDLLTLIDQNSALLVDSDCFSSQKQVVHVSFPPTAGSRSDVIIIANRNNSVQMPEFTSLKLPTALGSALLATEQVISTIFSSSTNNLLLLVGAPVAQPCILKETCKFNNARIINWDSTSATQTFAFNTNDVVTGMESHFNRYDVFVYGSKVWTSIDFCRSFSILQTLSANDYFVRFTSSSLRQDYALMSNAGYVYYGRIGSFSMISLGYWGPINLVNFDLNQGGELLAYIFDLNGQIGFPRSIYSDSNGAVRSSLTDSFITKNKIALNAYIPYYDSANLATLVPIQLSSDVLFYSSSQIFSSQSLGLAIKQSNSLLQALITKINSAGNLVQTSISNNYISQVCSAGTFDITLTFTGTQTNRGLVVPSIDYTPTLETATLGTAGNSWITSDVGKTIVLTKNMHNSRSGSILVTGITSGTLAQGQAVAYPVVDTTEQTSFLANEWYKCDFSSTAAPVTDFSQTINVAVQGGGLYKIDLAVGTFALQKYIDAVLTTSSGWGIVQYQNSGSLYVAAVQPFGATSFAAGQWSIYSNGVSNVVAGSALNTLSVFKSWSLVQPECPWTSFQSSTDDLIYLNYQDNHTLDAQIQFIQDKQVPTQVYTLLSNRSALTNGIVSALNQDEVANISIALTDIGTNGYTRISIRPSVMSLQCEQGILNKHIVASCPSSKRIFVSNLPTTMIELPPNYRPPSLHGRSVPTTNNIYNAKPEIQSNYWFPISKTTGIYKNCFGKTKSEDCECTEAQRTSQFIQDSDCIQFVPEIYSRKKYNPAVALTVQGFDIQETNASLYLKELNGRVDYCFSSVTDCNNVTILNNSPLLSNDTITWKGPGLYHFELLLANEGYCNLATEFAVFVLQADPETSEVVMVMSISSLIFFAWLVFIYVYYSHKSIVSW